MPSPACSHPPAAGCDRTTKKLSRHTVITAAVPQEQKPPRRLSCLFWILAEIGSIIFSGLLSSFCKSDIRNEGCCLTTPVARPTAQSAPQRRSCPRFVRVTPSRRLAGSGAVCVGRCKLVGRVLASRRTRAAFTIEMRRRPNSGTRVSCSTDRYLPWSRSARPR
jgi:hypothetical protein